MSEPGSRGEQGRGAATQVRPRALVTISRQHGARGAAVAKLVADRLGFTCWDRELVAAIASQLRIDPATMTPFDEHRRDAEIDSDPNRTSALARPSQADYVRGLNLVARSLVRRGSAVVVGRGLAFVLEPGECLRIRIVCPLEQRVAGLAERSQLSHDTARATIEYVDRERQAFIRELYGRDIDDAANYDLLISTGSLTVEAAADVIIAAYRTRFDDRRWPRSTIAPALTSAATRDLRGR